MNKVHRVVWNRCNNQWVAAAENAKGCGKSTRSAVRVALSVLPCLSFACMVGLSWMLSPAAHAAPCAGAFTTVINDGSGLPCEITGSNYVGILLSGTTSATTTGSLSVIRNAAGSNHAIRVWDLGSLTVNGDLKAIRTGASGVNAAVQFGAWPNVGGAGAGPHQPVTLITGNTVIGSNNGSGLRVIGGNNTFRGNVDVTLTGGSIAVVAAGGGASGSMNTIGGNLTIQSAGNDAALYADSDSRYSIGGNLSVTTTSTAIGTRPPAGVWLATGHLTVDGNSEISTQAATAHGIYASGASTASLEGSVNTISTVGNNAHGAYASGGVASIAIGATAASTTGPNVHLAVGNVSTAGSNAEGLYALSGASNVTMQATQSGGSITTGGLDSDGIVAFANGAAATGVTAIANQSGGSIVTTGQATTLLGMPINGSAGIVAQVAGNGEARGIQTGGSIHTSGTLGYGMAVLNSGTGDARAEQHSSIVTNGELGQGIGVQTNGGNAYVISTGSIQTNGQSAAGIFALASGDVDIDQGRGSITTTGVGQSVYLPPILTLLGIGNADTGNSDGILAYAQGGGGVNIRSGNINAAGDGIDANAMGGGNVNITTSGNIQAGEEGIDAYSESGNIVISNGASTTTGGTSILAVADTGTAQITNTGSITSSGGDGINVEAVAGGATVINNGNIIATSAGHYAIRGSAANDSVITTAGTIRGDISLDSGNDTFVASGGSINGSVFMGSGNDNAVLGGSFDPAELSQIDGSAGTDTLGISGLSLSGYTDSGAGGVNLTGWETINVEDGGTLKLTGDLFEAGPAGVRQLNIDASSTLDLTGNSPGIFTIHGSVSNAGTLTFADGAGDDQTTVAGNYAGASGSTILFDTMFNDDASATDRLVVNGDVSGASVLTVNNIGGSGAQTTHGIKLIQVDGSSGSSNFSWNIGNLQVGNYQYVLQQGSAVDANDWYLVSAVVPCEQSGTCSSNGNPNAPVVYAPGKPQPLWRPAVSAYSVARSMNADIGFMQTATLHQRQGDLNVQSAEEGKAWGRFLAQDLTGKGRDRFSYDQESQGFQLGHDLSNRTDEAGTRTRMGWLGHYVNSKTDAWDHVRPTAGLQAETGRISTESYGLGAYRTDIKGDGSYIDWMGHLNQIKNDFSDSYGERAKQKGWQVALAVENGMPLTSFEVASNQWTVEGQGQAVLLHTRYGAFEDNYSRMKGESFDALRARVGIRVHNRQGRVDGAEAQKTQYYGIVHLVHDLIKTREMTLSAKGVNQQVKAGETFDQTYLEVGAGVQTQMGEASWLWVDARFEAGLKNRKDTGKLSFGFKKSF